MKDNEQYASTEMSVHVGFPLLQCCACSSHVPVFHASFFVVSFLCSSFFLRLQTSPMINGTNTIEHNSNWLKSFSSTKRYFCPHLRMFVQSTDWATTVLPQRVSLGDNEQNAAEMKWDETKWDGEMKWWNERSLSIPLICISCLATSCTQLPQQETCSNWNHWWAIRQAKHMGHQTVVTQWLNSTSL